MGHDVPGKEELYFEALMNDIREDETTNIANQIACVSCLGWIRLLVSLQITKTFGPRIMTIISMAKDIGRFFIIFITQMFAFSIIASMVFYSVPEYDSIYHSFLAMFNTTFGNFDFTIFNAYPMDSFMHFFGHGFLMFFIVTNLILLLNMVIAMMSDTYNTMNETLIGIYYHRVLLMMPSFHMDETYGGLGAASSPMNILSLPFIPFYLGNEETQKAQMQRVTRIVYVMQYMPCVMMFTMIFAMTNIILMPFAYLRTCTIKFRNARSKAISC